jgi:uncharacterized protein (TIGR00255 family)
MTGYGKAETELPQKKVIIEIKTLNSKNLDLNVRIPAIYREKELEIRSNLSRKLIRGKIDFSMYVESTHNQSSNSINKDLVNNYIDQLRSIAVTTPESTLQIAMRLPDVLKIEREELDEKQWKTISKVIDRAIEMVISYRSDEGQVLENDFIKRIKTIQDLSIEINELDKERIQQTKNRLKRSLSELEQSIDENRFEQELIYYLEKLDITEEKVRLNNHLDYFLQQLKSGEFNGKKLGFISQEIGREINTTGSKSNFAPMQKIVVQMKDELEKIKEQLLNVL